MQSLQHSIKLAGEDIVGVLESWAFRLLSEKWPYQVLPRIHNSQELFSYIEKIPTSFPVERQALYYCDGAMALQQNRKSTLHEISMPQKRDLPLTWTCKFCFLEISDYRRAAMAWDMGAWNSLGMSHVVACVSYTDRRAAFKCIDCDDLELRKIYADPAVFIQHIKMHQDERRQARMDKSSINNREGALGRATSASAYETENSLDKSKPKFKDPDPEGKRLEREISRELGEEASDDSQAGETPEEFGNPKKVPLVASEPRTERGDGSSEADEEASSVASDEYQLRWGDPDSTAMSTRTLPTYTEAVGANPSRDAGQGGHRPGKAGVKAMPLGSDVKTRPMAKKGIQQEYVDVEDAGGDTVHKSQRKQEASDSTVQRRSDLHEAYNTPFSSYSLYNEHAEKEMLHEMETHKSKISPSATINRPQDNGEPAEAAKEQKVSNESLRAGNDRGGRELPEFAASRDLSTSKGTTPRAGVLPELPTAKGSNRKPTAPMAALTSGSIFDPTEVVMPAHNLGDPKSTSTVNQRTPDRNETGKGKDADLAEQIDFHKPATPRGGDGQGREQVFKTQDVPGGPISRPSRPAPDPPSTTGGMSQGRALYEYHARDPRQLSITAGDILKIVRKRDNGKALSMRPDREILTRTLLQTGGCALTLVLMLAVLYLGSMCKNYHPLVLSRRGSMNNHSRSRNHRRRRRPNGKRRRRLPRALFCKGRHRSQTIEKVDS
jgi:hypothetical protein